MGTTSALAKQKCGGAAGRERFGERPRVNEGRERGEGQKGKVVKRRVE